MCKQIEARLSMEEDFEICMVSPLSQLAHSLIDCKPDLMLIDPYFENSYKYDRIKLAMEMRPEMIVVVLTAVVDPAMSIRLKKEGVHCVLEKGLSSAELVDSLRKVIVDACEPKTSERP